MTITADRTKSKRSRTVVLDDTVFEGITALREQAKDRRPVKRFKHLFSKDHVFVSQYNTPRGSTLLRAFKRHCGWANIHGAESWGEVDIHGLRVSFCSIAIQHGADPKSVQETLGHSTLSMTLSTYARATESSKRAAVSSLPFAKASSPGYVVQFHPGNEQEQAPDGPNGVQMVCTPKTKNA